MDSMLLTTTRNREYGAYYRVSSIDRKNQMQIKAGRHMPLTAHQRETIAAGSKFMSRIARTHLNLEVLNENRVVVDRLTRALTVYPRSPPPRFIAQVDMSLVARVDMSPNAQKKPKMFIVNCSKFSADIRVHARVIITRRRVAMALALHRMVAQKPKADAKLTLALALLIVLKFVCRLLGWPLAEPAPKTVAKPKGLDMMTAMSIAREWL
jgi:hypothetical protein